MSIKKGFTIMKAQINVSPHTFADKRRARQSNVTINLTEVDPTVDDTIIDNNVKPQAKRALTPVEDTMVYYRIPKNHQLISKALIAKIYVEYFDNVQTFDTIANELGLSIPQVKTILDLAYDLEL